jgi:hypothetical protein
MPPRLQPSAEQNIAAPPVQRDFHALVPKKIVALLQD